MTFTRFVEVGRVCLINYGADAGKLCTIIDVVDHNRVLVDGPREVTGVSRGILPIRWLALTKFTTNTPRSAKSHLVAKYFKAAEIQQKWEKTGWAQKLARQEKRGKMNDFDRFKVMVARKHRSAAIKKANA